VAAGVQHDYGARCCGIQVGQHAFKVDTALGTDRKFNRMRPSMARRSGNLTALKSGFLAAAAS
jgi:hypothetical protein